MLSGTAWKLDFPSERAAIVLQQVLIIPVDFKERPLTRLAHPPSLAGTTAQAQSTHDRVQQQPLRSERLPNEHHPKPKKTD